MTLKAFAFKYNVPYTLVSEASLTVNHIATMERDVDYAEQDLYEAVIKKAMRKRAKVVAKVKWYDGIINAARSVHSGNAST